MNRVLLFLISLIFSFAALAQKGNETITVKWTQIKMPLPAKSLVPRELFKIDDTTLYLGCRHYLLKVSKDSLRLEFENKNKSANGVIRSVVAYEDMLYVSNMNGSIIMKPMNASAGKDDDDDDDEEDSVWVNLFDKSNRTVNGINWEIVVYQSELFYTTWPRWTEIYNFSTQSWRTSTSLNRHALGVTSGFETTDTDLFIALYGGGVYKKNANVDTWVNCNKGLPKDLNVRGIESIENKFLFAATENGVYYSPMTKFGWKVCKPTQIVGLKYVDLMYYNNVLYATGTDGQLLFSKDQGKTWTNVQIENSAGYVLYSIEAIGSDLYISADGQGSLPSGVFTIPIEEILSLKK